MKKGDSRVFWRVWNTLIIMKPLTSENTASLTKEHILQQTKCWKPGETRRRCAHNSRVSSTAFKTTKEDKYPKASTLTASQLIPFFVTPLSLTLSRALGESTSYFQLTMRLPSLGHFFNYRFIRKVWFLI